MAKDLILPVYLVTVMMSTEDDSVQHTIEIPLSDC